MSSLCNPAASLLGSDLKGACSSPEWPPALWGKQVLTPLSRSSSDRGLSLRPWCDTLPLAASPHPLWSRLSQQREVSLRAPIFLVPMAKRSQGEKRRWFCGLGEMIECTTVQHWGCSKLRPRVPSADTCGGSLHRAGSVALLLTLCRICLLQPSRGSEQVFPARCHLETLPSPITTLGFWAEKGG